MTPTLTALSHCLVLLAWEGQSGATYTVQTSSDLQTWKTLPVVFSGQGEALGLSLQALAAPLFTRLRTSFTGDTNENGIPDRWEWQAFGSLDVDPDGDPDEDGLRTLAEWEQGTHPLDPFNGQAPFLKVASGREWLVPAGAVSRQAICLYLAHASGAPWTGAPVHLRLDSGRAAFLQPGEEPSTASTDLTAYTDALGRLTPEGHSLHILGAHQADSLETLHITAGGASAEVRIRTLGQEWGGPPREVRLLQSLDGPLQLSWSGSAQGAHGFHVEEETDAGEWVSLLEIVAADLPEPDPLTGRYAITLNQTTP